MGILRRIDRRSEARTAIDLPLMVWGVDTKGERFLQEAHARDISLSGALLTGLDADLRSGDVVGILCGKRKARFRVVWVRYDETGDKMQVAVHRVEGDACPWQDLLAGEAAAVPTMGPPLSCEVRQRLHFHALRGRDALATAGGTPALHIELSRQFLR